MRALGIDYGEKNIGIAISHYGKTAAPLTVIPAKPTKKAVQSIGEIAEKNKIDTVVVGVPYTLSGGKSDQTEQCLKFAGKLHVIRNVEVKTIDERMTTKTARLFLYEQGALKKQKPAEIDKFAAAVILQSFLEKEAKSAG